MKAVVQRVLSASVSVEGKICSSIDRGLVTFLGVIQGDTEVQLAKLISKICDLRIFEDEAGKMNLSLRDVGGAHLIVSQFTLAGDCTSGKRPSFIQAARPEVARPLFEKSLELSSAMVPTVGGVFQADMKVALVNDGPVTLILES